jgi:uncharacterized protein YoxC
MKKIVIALAAVNAALIVCVIVLFVRLSSAEAAIENVEQWTNHHAVGGGHLPR